jgi:hypothetical protein
VTEMGKHLCLHLPTPFLERSFFTHRIKRYNDPSPPNAPQPSLRPSAAPSSLQEDPAVKSTYGKLVLAASFAPGLATTRCD